MLLILLLTFQPCRFGPVAKIVTFNKNSEFQGFVQYVDQLSAMAALNVSCRLVLEQQGSGLRA